LKDLGKIDGVDQWKSLTDTLEQVRSKVLINIDEKSGEEALIFNQWKVVKSKNYLYTSTISSLYDTILLKFKALTAKIFICDILV